MTDRDYQHSRPLDVHRWSDHPEANGFVDYVYDTYLNTQSNENHAKQFRLQLDVANVVSLPSYLWGKFSIIH